MYDVNKMWRRRSYQWLCKSNVSVRKILPAAHNTAPQFTSFPCTSPVFPEPHRLTVKYKIHKWHKWNTCTWYFKLTDKFTVIIKSFLNNAILWREYEILPKGRFKGGGFINLWHNRQMFSVIFNSDLTVISNILSIILSTFELLILALLWSNLIKKLLQYTVYWNVI